MRKSPQPLVSKKVKAPAGSSPYSTGGGGVSFAASVAAVYLASMLTGCRRPEVSELLVRRVAFQTGPQHPVDDLLVAYGDDESEVTLTIACRATPNFVQSDDETVKLVGSLPSPGSTHRGAALLRRERDVILKSRYVGRPVLEAPG